MPNIVLSRIDERLIHGRWRAVGRVRGGESGRLLMTRLLKIPYNRT